jgi:hypothetical protein
VPAHVNAFGSRAIHSTMTSDEPKRIVIDPYVVTPEERLRAAQEAQARVTRAMVYIITALAIIGLFFPPALFVSGIFVVVLCIMWLGKPNDLDHFKHTSWWKDYDPE